MGVFEHFPYTNFHDLNLNWVIKLIRELTSKVDSLESWESVHKYEYETLAEKVDGLIAHLVDAILPWDSSVEWPIYSIVSYLDSNYIAIQDVPVGTMITNTDYWVEANTVVEQINAISGSVSDLVEWKDLQMVTPQDFGAKADGVTDDAPAIQAAINYVYENYSQSVFQADWNQRAGAVYFPHGTYFLGGGIVLREGVRLLGENVDCVKLLCAGVPEVHYITNMYEGNHQRNVKIENLSIVAGDIYLTRDYKGLIDHVGIYSSPADALTILDPVGTTVTNTHIYGATGTALHISTDIQNATTFYGDTVWIAHCGQGVLIDPAISFEGCRLCNFIVEYCTEAGKIYSGTNKDSNQMVLENWYDEANGVGLYVYDCSLTVKDYFALNGVISPTTPTIRIKNDNKAWTAKDTFIAMTGLVYVDTDSNAAVTCMDVSNYYNDDKSEKTQDLADVAKGNTVDQTPGRTIHLAMNSACVSVTTSRLYCVVPLPFITKNVNYQVNVTSASVVNVGSVTATVTAKNYNSFTLQLDKNNAFSNNASYWVNGGIDFTFA